MAPRLAMIGLAAAALGASAPGASAMPLQDGYTVDARIGLLWQDRRTETLLNGRAKTSTSTFDDTVSLRLFRVKGQLIVSMPDLSAGTVFTDGKERIKNAFRVGAGQYACKKLDQEAGAVGQVCFMYQEQANALIVSHRYIGDQYDATGEYERVFRIRFAAGDCTAELVSGKSRFRTDEGGMVVLPDVKSSETVGTAQFNGSSCRLLKGRKAF